MSEHPAILSKAYALDFQELVASEKIQQALILWVEEIRDWANGNGYLVGHIKVFIDGQENLWLSSTGRSISLKPSTGWSNWQIKSINLNLTAIIFGTSKEVLTQTAQVRLQECFMPVPL